LLKFSVGVARGFKREDGTDWINCSLFGERAEKLAPYLIKGTKVLVEGVIRINLYEKDGAKKSFTEVLVNNVEFIGGKSDSTHEQPNNKGTDTGKKTHSEGFTPVGSNEIDDGEIPW